MKLPNNLVASVVLVSLLTTPAAASIFIHDLGEVVTIVDETGVKPDRICTDESFSCNFVFEAKANSPTEQLFTIFEQDGSISDQIRLLPFVKGQAAILFFSSDPAAFVTPKSTPDEKNTEDEIDFLKIFTFSPIGFEGNVQVQSDADLSTHVDEPAVGWLLGLGAILAARARRTVAIRKSTQKAEFKVR